MLASYAFDGSTICRTCFRRPSHAQSLYALDTNAQEHRFGVGGPTVDDYFQEHTTAIDDILEQAVKKDK
jgi:hypothetical protein